MTTFDDRLTALRRDFHQFTGDLANTFAEPCATLLPRFSTQPVKHHGIFRRSVTAEHVDIFNRDVELVAALILQHHAIVLALTNRNRLQPQIFADTMFDMDDQITSPNSL